MSKYTPATFQPTVRPDWAGILSYLSDKEKSEILTALFKYPSDVSNQCDSAFWKETIKPDLDLQYQAFIEACKAKSRGVRNRWGKISITDVKDMNKTSIRHGIDTEREREEKSEGEKCNNIPEDSILVSGIRAREQFVPPPLEEVLEYAQQQNEIAGMGGFKCSQETAEQFWAHYESIGWRIGNDAKTPITNWKPKLRQWATKEKTTPPHETERERKERINREKLEELKRRSEQ